MLTPENVSQSRNPGGFGKLFFYDLAAIGGQPAGEVYAQPLYVSNVSVPGHGVANMLLVATMGNFVLALDADGPSPERDGVLWKHTFGTAPDMNGDVWKNCPVSHCLAPIGGNIQGTAGIGGTPLIDRQRGIVFVVNRERVGAGIEIDYRLHALDLHDGHELPGSPTSIRGSYLGAIFNPNWQNQRVGLAMSRGQIIIGFGAYEDLLAYRGWIFSYHYQDNSFAQTGVMTTTPDGDTSALCAQVQLTPASLAAQTVLTTAEAKLAVDVVSFPPLVSGDVATVAAAQAAFDAIAAPQVLRAANTCAHGGLWMTGRAPAVDPDGRVLFMVGNGRNDMGTGRTGTSAIACSRSTRCR